MFGIGGFELILILLFAFLVLGPDKLPEMAKTAGKVVARFRDARKDMDDALRESDLVDAKTGKPITDPVAMIDKVAKAAADGKGGQIAEQMSTAAAAAASTLIKPHSKATDGETAAAGAGSEADAGTGGVSGGVSGGGMSFAERKARYDRERAAREAARAQAEGQAETPIECAPGGGCAEAAGENPSAGENLPAKGGDA